MNNIQSFIESGKLEAYILGLASSEEIAEVERYVVASAEVRTAVDEISTSLEKYLQINNPIAPDPTIKPFLMATINYTERLKNGEPESHPPMLQSSSTISDFEPWLNRSDLQFPSTSFHDFHAWIIGYTPQMTTAIVWIKDAAPSEVHTNEFEKFLVLEGTCDITIENEVHQLVAGDVLSIPLFKKHFVKVTSLHPCKVILQRIAA
jgi:mannose-6-phosphate isomerase-like protein (cupin superfamily)